MSEFVSVLRLHYQSGVGFITTCAISAYHH